MSNRRNFVKTLAGGISSVSLLPLLSPVVIGVACSTGTSDEWIPLIEKAGNAEDETVRYQYLKQATELPRLDPALLATLKKLLEVVDQWENGKERFNAFGQGTSVSTAYLCGFFNRKVGPDAHILPEVSEDSPLFPLTAFYRARMLVAQVIQHGDLQHDEQLRSAYYGEAQLLMKTSQTAFPQNPLIGMYLGKPIPWPGNFEADSQAPEWANLQRECLEKLTDIIHWWIDNRQVKDGQFGGGWGDDVEMWRKWIPVLVAFDDPKVNQSQALLSEGLFALDRMKAGYTNQMTDVEHTAEDSADTCTAMLHIQPDNPLWQKRAMRLVELMRSLWTGRNQKGFLQFKSTYFTSDEVDNTPRKACDTVYHPRAIQPALLHWQRTGDPAITSLVTDWMKTWVDVSSRAERGKPKGIIPSAIHWPEGNAGGLNEEWWKPGNYTTNPLYVWPSAMYMMVNSLLLTYYMTKDRLYLEPIFSMARIYRKYGLQSKEEEKETGSLEWCAGQMHRFMPDVLAKYQILTKDGQWDDLLTKDGNGYIQFRLNGDRDALLQDFKKNAAAFAQNYVAFTDEVRWTDRVFSFASAYLNRVNEEQIPDFQPDFLFSSLTGNIGNALYFPINAVRWRTNSREIAVLVTRAGTDQFEAELYHFGSSPRKLAADLFLLRPGDYRLQLAKGKDGELISEQLFVAGTTTTQIELELPSRTLCKLRINPY